MMIDTAKWISVPAETNSFWLFRRAFDVPTGTKARLEIAADTNFAVFCNGAWIPGAQLMDMPPRRNVTELSLTLRPGRNVLAVSLYYSGRDSLNYRTGEPGLAAVVIQDGKVLAKTGDEGWQYRRDEAYLPGEVLVTTQLGFTYAFDARLAFDWQHLDASDDGWKIPEISNAPVEYAPREVSLLDTTEAAQIRICQAGYLLRT